MFLKHHALELLQEILEVFLAILLEEKPGVFQARPQHPLVAPPDRLGIGGLHVADGDEMRKQPAAGTHHGEIALVMLHRHDQKFPRQFQVLVLEPAQNGDRVLHQEIDLVQEAEVLFHLAADRLGQVFKLFHDKLSPGFRVDRHVPLLAFFQVRVEAGHRERLRLQKPVTPGASAAGDAVELKIQRSAPKQGDQPMHRPGEGLLPVRPPHLLGKRNPTDETGQKVI